MTDEVLPISALSFDPANPRLRTERSAHVIRSSLQRYGPLRSLVGQKLPDGRIVIRAGNGTLEEAGQIGIEKVRLIQRRADELVVVVADDLDEEKWVQYSVDDNRASDLSTWDPAILEQISQDIDLSNSFLEGELDDLIESLAGLTEGLGDDDDMDRIDRELQSSFKVEIDCVDESMQESIYNEMVSRGLSCRLLTL